ncbi:hypothetical protein SAMN00017477_1891 [Peptoniphilus asaccharolyticus DSM 20463]|uniref:Uncharacterized protein n=1 Tax=Peptoniphilus asaccharolyticus DSM 20463 TaxID=573058 RepID=A0A1W1VFT0_PEPAS|nr:hypothetical protein [Peptoniphilus asaccharolyticus]MBL7575884.1 hypothetical protein [Peptoniphilus asaccharolyticus]SMB92080.1 hypothetical protein SAMN00017477_1891 [Peptoniphilus asaccharolyticus DSM 20463]
MDNTLLINKINIQGTDEEREIFFLIGDMDKNIKILLDNFNSVDSKYYGLGKLKYNGMSLNILTSEIPAVIEKLVELKVKIYGVYELYGSN